MKTLFLVQWSFSIIVFAVLFYCRLESVTFPSIYKLSLFHARLAMNWDRFGLSRELVRTQSPVIFSLFIRVTLPVLP